MIVVDILCVVGVFYLKFELVHVTHHPHGDVIAEFVNAAQIVFLAFVYTNIGMKLFFVCCEYLLLYSFFKLHDMT